MRNLFLLPENMTLGVSNRYKTKQMYMQRMHVVDKRGETYIQQDKKEDFYDLLENPSALLDIILYA